MSARVLEIGQAIERSRKLLGLTQVELAEVAGISYRPVYQIESGRSIRLESLVALCDALGLKISLTSMGGVSPD